MTTTKALLALAALSVTGLSGTAGYAQDPYSLKDNTQITISGTAVSTDDDSLVLDYGGGTITVELGGWDWLGLGNDEQQEQVRPGDRVVVQGEVDDELFEQTKIKADYVFIQDTGTQFATGQARPQQQQPPLVVASWTFVDFDTVVEGTVTSVSQEQKAFTLRTGTTSTETLTVDTSGLQNDPLDKDGYQQIKKGDRVAVSGDLDAGSIESRKLMAENVVSLNRGERLRAAGTAAGDQRSTTTNRPDAPGESVSTTGTQTQ